MRPSRTELPVERRDQILKAAMICFGKKGFHQSSMHDISEEAGISVGLIYRYFESKEAVISALAEEHKKELQDLVERARTAPTLLESLEILMTSHCCEDAPENHAAFVMDLFAEAGRNAQIADLVRGVIDAGMAGVTDVIARSPEMQEAAHGLEPHEVTELIFSTARGSLMRDVIERDNISPAARRERQLTVVRNLWRLLFNQEAVSA